MSAVTRGPVFHQGPLASLPKPRKYRFGEFAMLARQWGHRAIKAARRRIGRLSSNGSEKRKNPPVTDLQLILTLQSIAVIFAAASTAALTRLGARKAPSRIRRVRRPIFLGLPPPSTTYSGWRAAVTYERDGENELMPRPPAQGCFSTRAIASSTRPSMFSSPPPIPSDSATDRLRAVCSHCRSSESFISRDS
jgi:hypothetical protein